MIYLKAQKIKYRVLFLRKNKFQKFFKDAIIELDNIKLLSHVIFNIECDLFIYILFKVNDIFYLNNNNYIFL